MNQIFRHIRGAVALLAVSFLFALGCGQEQTEVPEGTGSVRLRVAAASAQTRHTSGEGSGASDGGLIRTLRVWLVGAADSKVTHYASMTVDDTEETVTFTDVPRGSYKIYVVANYTALDSYVVGSTINEGFTKALAGSVSAGQSPSFTDAAGMPLSWSGDVDVAAGDNEVEAGLKRCAGRLTFILHNLVKDKEVFIHSMGLSDYNMSQGYLFAGTDYSGVSTVAFPDLNSAAMGDTLVHVAPLSYKTVYDIYLYETDPEAVFTFDILAALYPEGTVRTDVSVNSRAAEEYELQGNSVNFSSSGQYLIRSANSSTYYLGNTSGSTLSAKSFTDDSNLKSSSDFTNYLWTFSSSEGNVTTIKNYTTGRYMNITDSGYSLSNSTSTSSNISSRVTSNERLRFYRYLSSSEYFLRFDGSSISVSNSTTDRNERNWYVRPVKINSGGLVYYFVSPDNVVARNDRPVKYIDTYGTAQPLTKIDRNEHVTVHVNLYYNTEVGEFRFEVVDWEDGGEHNTSFN